MSRQFRGLVSETLLFGSYELRTDCLADFLAAPRAIETSTKTTQPQMGGYANPLNAMSNGLLVVHFP